MKKTYLIIATLILSAVMFAQSPQKMSYQAVIRNSSNALVTDTQVGMQISILQGSPTGTAVYMETQTPTANANGLMSLELGEGTVVSGTFASIDWAAGPYFIKTESDPAGGINYTITGISQILSVPYALHAKTAERITGTITETDPVFGTSVAGGINGTDTAYWNNKQEKLTAGTGIHITGNVIGAIADSALSIGDNYQGGIIFWLDVTGQHGLITAPSDQSSGEAWKNGPNINTGATGDGLYAGAMNTTMIIAAEIATNTYFAAKICADYSATSGGVTYGDWYLPSEYELNLLYLQKDVIGGFSTGTYWSSCEINDGQALFQKFDDGSQASSMKLSPNRVRAIRAF